MEPTINLNKSFVEHCFLQKQSEKTQGFCVAEFETLSDERRSRSKIYLLFVWIKEPCVRKFERLARSKLLGISQTRKIQHFAIFATVAVEGSLSV